MQRVATYRSAWNKHSGNFVEFSAKKLDTTSEARAVNYKIQHSQ